MSLDSIDIRNAEFRAKAITLALEASEPNAFGGLDTKQLHTMAGEAKYLESVYIKNSPTEGEATVCAVTGNGPNSRKNAEFYAYARKIVLGYEEQLDHV